MVRDMLVDFPDYMPNTYLQYYYYPEYKKAKLDPCLLYTSGFKNYGGNAPTIFAKLKGNVPGEGVTLAAHMDVVEPVSYTHLDVYKRQIERLLRASGTKLMSF